MITVFPFAINWLAMASPMPLLPPVIKIVLLVSFIALILEMCLQKTG